jgi:hypothetical protein
MQSKNCSNQKIKLIKKNEAGKSCQVGHHGRQQEKIKQLLPK